MSDITESARKMAKLIKNGKKTSSYDDEGTVTRVDAREQTIWVRFNDGDDETPVRMTINARPGDKVKVRVAGHTAWIVGNETDPPMGAQELHHEIKYGAGGIGKDIKEVVAKEVEDIEGGSEVVKIVTEYCLASHNVIPEGGTFEDIQETEWSEELPEYVPGSFYWTRDVIYYADGEIKEQDPIFYLNGQIAAEAKQLIDSTNNHFWYDETGAWVTEEESSKTSGYATAVKAQGIQHMYNGVPLFTQTSSALTFYKSTSTLETPLPMAWYGSSGIGFADDIPFTIGNTNSYMKWVQENGQWKLKINADVIQFGGDDVLTSNDVNPYSIGTSVDWITYDPNAGTVIPTSLTAYSYKGEDSYSGRIRFFGSNNGTSWTTLSTSSSDESSKTYSSISSSYKFYKITLYEAGGTTNELVSKTIPVVDDGGDGRGISSITKVSTSGNVDTYRITYTDGTTSTYTVTNGEDVTSKYVTFISENYGVRVYSKAGQPNTYAQVNSDGLSVVKANTPVAQFGSDVVLGDENSRHVTIDSGGFSIYDSDRLEGNNNVLNIDYTSSNSETYIGRSYNDLTRSKSYDSYIKVYDGSLKIGADYTSSKSGVVINNTAYMVFDATVPEITVHNTLSAGWFNVTNNYQRNGFDLFKRATISKDNISVDTSGFTAGSISISSTDQENYNVLAIAGWDISNASSSGSGASKVTIGKLARASTTSIDYELATTNSGTKIKLEVYVLLYAK